MLMEGEPTNKQTCKLNCQLVKENQKALFAEASDRQIKSWLTILPKALSFDIPAAERVLLTTCTYLIAWIGTVTSMERPIHSWCRANPLVCWPTRSRSIREVWCGRSIIWESGTTRVILSASHTCIKKSTVNSWRKNYFPSSISIKLTLTNFKCACWKKNS